MFLTSQRQDYMKIITRDFFNKNPQLITILTKIIPELQRFKESYQSICTFYCNQNLRRFLNLQHNGNIKYEISLINLKFLQELVNNKYIHVYLSFPNGIIIHLIYPTYFQQLPYYLEFSTETESGLYEYLQSTITFYKTDIFSSLKIIVDYIDLNLDLKSLFNSTLNTIDYIQSLFLTEAHQPLPTKRLPVSEIVRKKYRFETLNNILPILHQFEQNEDWYRKMLVSFDRSITDDVKPNYSLEMANDIYGELELISTKRSDYGYITCLKIQILDFLTSNPIEVQEDIYNEAEQTLLVCSSNIFERNDPCIQPK